MIDLSDWRDEYEAAQAEADHFCKARAKGIPEDRWTTTEGQHKVARFIEMQNALVWLFAKENERLTRECYEKGLEAMKMAGE
jgi:hypothetical protein